MLPSLEQPMPHVKYFFENILRRANELGYTILDKTTRSPRAKSLIFMICDKGHPPINPTAYDFIEKKRLCKFCQSSKQGKKNAKYTLEFFQELAKKKGGILLTKELRGIDVKDKAFWQSGFDIIQEQINELRKLV